MGSQLATATNANSFYHSQFCYDLEFGKGQEAPAAGSTTEAIQEYNDIARFYIDVPF